VTAITAVILAGGQGSRVRHLLPDIPKPLAVFAGRPFLEWVIRLLIKEGVTEFTISSGYRGEKVAEFAADLRERGISTRVAYEDVPLGTAGGFLNALAASPSGTPVVMACNGDSLLLSHFDSLFRALADPALDAVIAGVRMEDTSRSGTISMNAEGLLSGFKEKQSGSGLVNAGLYLFRRDTVRMFGEKRPLSFEFDVFPSLLEQGARIRVIALTGSFLDIGTEETLAQADAFIRDNMRWFA